MSNGNMIAASIVCKFLKCWEDHSEYVPYRTTILYDTLLYCSLQQMKKLTQCRTVPYPTTYVDTVTMKKNVLLMAWWQKLCTVLSTPFGTDTTSGTGITGSVNDSPVQWSRNYKVLTFFWWRKVCFRKESFKNNSG